MSESQEKQPTSDSLPEAHFEDQDSPLDWRAEDQDDEDPDDEEVDTPDDVIMMLGFDPVEDEDERMDAEFEESDHPRDQTGRFAQTAEGAAAGRDYHLGEEKEWLEKREGTVYRPHRRAAASYEEARGHYEHGQMHRGQAAHREAESHGSVAERRAARLVNSELEDYKPQGDSRQAEILRELSEKKASDVEYKVAFSTGSKVALKTGETWKSRLTEWVKKMES